MYLQKNALYQTSEKLLTTLNDIDNNKNNIKSSTQQFFLNCIWKDFQFWNMLFLLTKVNLTILNLIKSKEHVEDRCNKEIFGLQENIFIFNLRPFKISPFF